MKNFIIKLQKISRIFIVSTLLTIILISLGVFYHNIYKQFGIEGVFYLTLLIMFTMFIILGINPIFKEENKKSK